MSITSNSIPTLSAYCSKYRFRQKPFPLSPKQKAEVRRRYLAGENVKALQQAFSVGRVAIIQSIGKDYKPRYLLGTKEFKRKKPYKGLQPRAQARDCDALEEPKTWDTKKGWKP